MNELLRYCLNRETGYESTAFPLESDFTPLPESPEAATVRRILNLGPGYADYYHVAALGLLKAFPIYSDQLGERETTYELRAYKRPADIFQYGKLWNDKYGHPIVARIPKEWPINFTISLSYESATTAVARWGNSEQSVETRESGGRLFLDWPAESGVRGAVYPRVTWEAGAMFSIHHVPVAYPHTRVVELLRNNPATQEILRSAELSGIFFQTRNPAEQIAIVLTALGLHQRDYVG